MITVKGSVMGKAKQLQVAAEHHHVPLIEINFSFLFFVFYDLTEYRTTRKSVEGRTEGKSHKSRIRLM